MACIAWPDGNAVGLLAIADAAEVLTPRCLLGIAEEIRPSDMVVMPELTTAQAGEVGLRAIGAGTVEAVAVLVVDALHGEAGVQRVPGAAFIGMNHGAFVDPLADRRQAASSAGPPAPAYGRHARASRRQLAFARLVLGEPSVDRSAARFSGRTWPPK